MADDNDQPIVIPRIRFSGSLGVKHAWSLSVTRDPWLEDLERIIEYLRVKLREHKEPPLPF